MSFTDIGMTSEQREAVENLRGFLNREIKPIVDEYKGKVFPKEVIRNIFQQLIPYGVVGGTVPEEHGGLGLDLQSYGLLFMEVCRLNGSLGISLLIHSSLCMGFADRVSDELREKYLPDLLAANKLVCACVSEPDVGSNVAEAKTRARPDGDHFIINGEKTWISNGDWSDLAIVTCYVDPDNRRGTISHFLIDREEHGYESRNIEKMGLESASTAQMFFSDCRVPKENLLGEIGDGLKATLKGFEVARIHVGMVSTGIAMAALDHTVEYVQQRTQFGKPLASHQLVAGMLAEMVTEVDAMRCILLRNLRLLETGVRCETETSAGKWYCTEKAVDVCGKAIQIHGGNGITKEFPVEQLFRDAKIMPIPDGTTEIQKLIISRAVTGIQAFI